MRASEPCGVTVPGSFLSAVSFFEEAGAVDQGKRFSESSLIKKTAKSIRKQLSSAAWVKERKKAELLLIAQLRSWELLVVTSRKEVPIYFRAYAWARCVKVWTALRFDCTRGLLPESLFWNKEAGLEGVLGRSKTTGAGKKTEIRRFWISPEAWLASPDWLEAGFAIWKSEGFNFDRDYLIPVPNSSYTGAVPRAALYVEAAALSSSLWEFLRVPWLTYVDDTTGSTDQSFHATASNPRGDTGLGDCEGPKVDSPSPSFLWRESELPLFHCQVGTFWTEHAERNWVNTWGAAMEVPKEHR